MAREPCNANGARIAAVRSREAGQRIVSAEFWRAFYAGTGWVTLVQRTSAVSHPALCSVTASGQNRRPAAARSSASIASPCGLRFPLEILFAKCSEKISPEPP
jgi:hypothetical protein